MTWTVGPWQEVEHRLVPPAHAYPVSGGFGTVAFVIGSEEEARLIAAAPDLLAALKGWRDWYADDDSSVTQATDLMPQTRAAIAKAEGES